MPGSQTFFFIFFEISFSNRLKVFYLSNLSKVLELILFADGTNIFYSHTDASCLMEVVNLELKKITCWFYTNKLSINVRNIQTKTKQAKT